MKTNLAAILIVAMVLVVLTAVPTLAGELQHPRGQTAESGRSGGPLGRHMGPNCPAMGIGLGPFWRDERIARELALSEEQINRLEDLQTAHARNMIALESEMRLAHFDLQQVLERVALDEGAAKKAIENVLMAQRKIMQAELTQRLAVLKVLTPEQIKKLEQFDIGDGTPHRRRWPFRDTVPTTGGGRFGH